MNSLTANLHLMMISFYRPDGRRRRIAIEADAFPSDRYAVESQIRLHGLDPADTLVELRPREGEASLRTADMEAAIERLGDSLALILLGGVQYLTGQWFDLGRIARAGREAGAVVGFDLAHAIGNVPLSLHAWDADFAVWCSYKYLNGGPGAPGGCFVHRRHAGSAELPRLAGWWGNDPAVRFRMERDFAPQPGAAGWQVSNPPILAMAALKASLDLFHEVGMPALRAKSERLTAYLLDLLATDSRGLAEVVTPADPSRRGCQLSLRITTGARELTRELARRGIVCDAREPDILRAAPVPLYNRYHEVWEFARTLREILGS
jgi:kynureninase